MKKVLMLGGTHFQIESIKTAKRLGYHVITCDYIENNPGHKFADEYYNISTTDKEAVLSLAKKLSIDGIVCYASDPAAPTAAYVAEKMGFPTSPYKSVEILSNKDMFREFLQAHNFNVPKAKGYSDFISLKNDINTFRLPIMIKPVDSSGSKGVSKITDTMKLEEKVNYALGYSRAKRIIVEEFVEKHGYQIAGDGFSVNGNLVFRCFANEHFDVNSDNPFVPIGESFPYYMPQKIHDKIHCEVQRLISLLNMQTGAYNFDIRIDKDENVYIMELGPRNGGNLIPEVTRYATGVDMIEYTVKAAMGEDCTDLVMKPCDGYWSSFMIHSNKPGKLKEIYIDPEFREKNIVEYNMLFDIGDEISAFTGSNGTLGTMILKFDSMDEMLEKMDNMNRWFRVIAE